MKEIALQNGVTVIDPNYLSNSEFDSLRNNNEFISGLETGGLSFDDYANMRTMPDPSDTLYSNGGSVRNASNSAAAANANDQNPGGLYTWLYDLTAGGFGLKTGAPNTQPSFFNEIGNAASGVVSTVTDAAASTARGFENLASIPSRFLDAGVETANDAISFMEIAIIGVIVAVIVFASNVGNIKLPKSVNVKSPKVIPV